MKDREDIDKMFIKYKGWLEKGTLKREVAAFEYMKRNPYFINIATYYRKILLNNELEYPLDLEYSTDDIKHICKQVFLYNATDFEKEGFSQQLSKYLEFDDRCAEARYYQTERWYSYIYQEFFDEIEEDHLIQINEKNRSKIKKQFPVDLDEFNEESSRKRWLEHLLPELYIKINPLDTNEEILKKIKRLLGSGDRSYWNGDLNQGFIDTKSNDSSYLYSSLSAPEIILDKEDNRIFNFDNGNYYEVPTAISLIMYDLVEVFMIKNPKLLGELLKDNFGENYLDKFHKYFEYSAPARGSILKLKTDEIKKNKEKVEKRIRGDYLKLIYPPESIKLHSVMINNMTTKNEMKDLKEKLLKDNTLLSDSFPGNIDIMFSSKVTLDAITDLEYTEWQLKVYSMIRNKSTSKEIFDTLSL